MKHVLLSISDRGPQLAVLYLNGAVAELTLLRLRWSGATSERSCGGQALLSDGQLQMRLDSDLFVLRRTGRNRFSASQPASMIAAGHAVWLVGEEYVHYFESERQSVARRVMIMACLPLVAVVATMVSALGGVLLGSYWVCSAEWWRLALAAVCSACVAQLVMLAVGSVMNRLHNVGGSLTGVCAGLGGSIVATAMIPLRYGVAACVISCVVGALLGWYVGGFMFEHRWLERTVRLVVRQHAIR